ncbi:MAG: hypothetical protein H0X67_09295 [Acidobacteria bacterium]|nr:hypothetical protein [Acidobacteriota bacterium]
MVAHRNIRSHQDPAKEQLEARFVVKSAKQLSPAPPPPSTEQVWERDHGVRADGSLAHDVLP